jgi:hypothetical protein
MLLLRLFLWGDADYTQGVEACCKFYLGLLDSSSLRMQELCCAHLTRLASNGNRTHSLLWAARTDHSALIRIPADRWRSLVIEMQVIGRLSTVIFAPATPSELQLTIANIFLALMHISTAHTLILFARMRFSF